MPIPRAENYFALAHVRHEQQDEEQANTCLARTREIGRQTNGARLMYMSGLTEAYFAFEREQETLGLRALDQDAAWWRWRCRRRGNGRGRQLHRQPIIDQVWRILCQVKTGTELHNDPGCFDILAGKGLSGQGIQQHDRSPWCKGKI